MHALSNGEQFRVHVARTLAEMPDLAVVDEFTSVVDRTAARIGSAAVAKSVRRRNQKFIAVTCHYDVLDWLEPDWVYEPHLEKLTLAASRESPCMAMHGQDLRRWLRPPIDLEVAKVHSSLWKIFRPHHYLSGKLHPSAQCFAAIYENQPAAFVAVLPFPHPIRPGFREHRCVCLPEFQGVGIGNALSEFIAGMFTDLGKPYFSTTSHPGMIRHRVQSPQWKLTRKPSFTHGNRGLRRKWPGGPDRLTAGFEFIGTGRVSP
jgi:hypothetical protein